MKKLSIISAIFLCAMLTGMRASASCGDDQLQQAVSSAKEQIHAENRDLRAATTTEQRVEIDKKFEQILQDYKRQILPLVQLNPKSAPAEEALRLLLVNISLSPPEHAEVVLMYLKNWSKSPAMLQIIPQLAHDPLSTADKLLHVALRENKSNDARAAACYALAQKYESTDPHQSARLYQRLQRNYGNLSPVFPRATYAALAKDGLLRVKSFSVGAVPPPLSGPGLDGKTLDLNEFHGKIVLVDFFGDW